MTLDGDIGAVLAGLQDGKQSESDGWAHVLAQKGPGRIEYLLNQLLGMGLCVRDVDGMKVTPRGNGVTIEPLELEIDPVPAEMLTLESDDDTNDDDTEMSDDGNDADDV